MPRSPITARPSTCHRAASSWPRRLRTCWHAKRPANFRPGCTCRSPCWNTCRARRSNRFSSSSFASSRRMPRRGRRMRISSTDPAELLAAVEQGLGACPDPYTLGMLLVRKAFALNGLKRTEEAVEILQRLIASPGELLSTHAVAYLALACHSSAPGRVTRDAALLLASIAFSRWRVRAPTVAVHGAPAQAGGVHVHVDVRRDLSVRPVHPDQKNPRLHPAAHPVDRRGPGAPAAAGAGRIERAHPGRNRAQPRVCPGRGPADRQHADDKRESGTTSTLAWIGVVLVFVAALGCLTTVLFGLAPAFRASAASPAAAAGIRRQEPRLPAPAWPGHWSQRRLGSA